MLNGLAFVILLSSCFEKVNLAREPLEDLLLPYPSSYEERVFTICVLHGQTLYLVLIHGLEHTEALCSHSIVKWCLSLMVWGESQFTVGLHDLG